ncbi:MAG: hypothetical protein RI906_720 [Pseudomonadota bacterium]
MKHRTYGFTLIEILVGIAIVAVLAALAIPSYQSYVTRSRIAEALTAADAARTTVQEALTAGQPVAADLLASSGKAADAVHSVRWQTAPAGSPAAGAIVASINIPGLGKRAALALEWRADGGWHCVSAEGYAAGEKWVEPAYLPSSCKDASQPMPHVMAHNSAPDAQTPGSRPACQPNQVEFGGRCNDVCNPGWVRRGTQCELAPTTQMAPPQPSAPALPQCKPHQVLVAANQTCVNVCSEGWRINGNRCAQL